MNEIVTQENLNSLTISPTEIEIEVRGKIFKRDKFVAKKKRDKLENICDRYKQKNLQFLLVEYELFFLFFVEKKEVVQPKIERKYNRNYNFSSIPTTKRDRASSIQELTASANQQSQSPPTQQSTLLPATSEPASTPKIIKKYRGVSYERAIDTDSASLELKASESTKKHLKYRGRYY